MITLDSNQIFLKMGKQFNDSVEVINNMVNFNLVQSKSTNKKITFERK